MEYDPEGVGARGALLWLHWISFSVKTACNLGLEHSHPALTLIVAELW